MIRSLIIDVMAGQYYEMTSVEPYFCLQKYSVYEGIIDFTLGGAGRFHV